MYIVSICTSAARGGGGALSDHAEAANIRHPSDACEPTAKGGKGSVSGPHFVSPAGLHILPCRHHPRDVGALR